MVVQLSGCVVAHGCTCADLLGQQALTKGEGSKARLLCKHFGSKAALLLDDEHWPKAGKKKRLTKCFFSGTHFILDASSESGLTQLSPAGR